MFYEPFWVAHLWSSLPRLQMLGLGESSLKCQTELYQTIYSWKNLMVQTPDCKIFPLN